MIHSKTVRSAVFFEFQVGVSQAVVYTIISPEITQLCPLCPRPVTKKTAGFLGFYQLSAAIRSVKCRAGLEWAEGKPSSLLGFLGYCVPPAF